MTVEPNAPAATTAETPKLGGLLRHSAIYSAAPLLRQVISFGMTMFYTGWLATDGYGVKDVIDLWMIALQQILGMNVLGAIVRLYYDGRDARERASMVTSVTILVTTVAVIVCGLGYYFTPQLKPLLLGGRDVVGSNDLVAILALMFVLIPFQLSRLSGMYYLMATKRSGAYTSIETIKLLVEIALNFLLIGHLGMGVKGFLLSMLIGEAATAVFLVGWMFWHLGVRFEPRVLRPVLAYAAPLIPVGVCQLALHTLDRRLLIQLAPTDNEWDQAGIYGLAYKLGFLVTAMLLGPFLQIFHPWIFGITDPRERAEHVARISTWAVTVVGAVSLGVIFFGRQATMILDHDGNFWDAYLVIPYITIGYVFWALYHASQMPLLIAKRTGRLLVINLAAVVVNVAANIYLIPREHFVGAGMATAITFAALATFGMIASRKEAEVPFELRRLASVVVTVGAGAAFTLFVDGREASDAIGLVSSIVVKTVGLAALLAGIWFGIVKREERDELVAWIRARLGKPAAEA